MASAAGRIVTRRSASALTARSRTAWASIRCAICLAAALIGLSPSPSSVPMSAHSSASSTARSWTDRPAVSRTIRVARHSESAPHSSAARVCGMSCTSALATDKYRLPRAGESRRANPTSLATPRPAGRPARRRRPDQRGAVRPRPRPRAPDPPRRPTSPAPTHRSVRPRRPHRHADLPPPIPPHRTYMRHYTQADKSRTAINERDALARSPARRCNFDDAATRQSMPAASRNRANPNPVGPAS
jgi:hypothetical protein